MLKRFWRSVSNYGEQALMTVEAHRQNRVLNHGFVYAIGLYLVTYLVALAYFYFLLKADFPRYWRYFWPFTAACLLPALATLALFFLRGKPGYSTVATIVTYLVAVLHNLAMLLFLGLAGGFQFFLVALIPAAYLAHPHRRRVYIPLYVVTFAALFCGVFWSLTHPPLFPIPEPFLSITFYTLLGTSSSFFLACFAYVADKYDWVKRVMVYWEALSVYGLKWTDSDDERTHHIITNQTMVLHAIFPPVILLVSLTLSTVLLWQGTLGWWKHLLSFSVVAVCAGGLWYTIFIFAAKFWRAGFLFLFLLLDLGVVTALVLLTGSKFGIQYFYFPLITLPIYFFPGRRRLFIAVILTLIFAIFGVIVSPKIEPWLSIPAWMVQPVYLIVVTLIAGSILIGFVYIWWQRGLTRRAFEYWEIVSYRSIPKEIDGDEKQWHALVNRIVFLTAIFWGPIYGGSQGFVLGQFWYHAEKSDYILRAMLIAFPHTFVGAIGSFLVFRLKTGIRFYTWHSDIREIWLCVLFALNSILWLWGGLIYSFHVPLAIFNLAGLQAFFLLKQSRWSFWQIGAVLTMAISGCLGLWWHFKHEPWLPLPAYVTVWTLPVAIIYLVTLVVAITFYGRSEADKSKAALAVAHQKSESLLLNILPRDVADELKDKGHSAPVRIESVTVMFTDFAGFTKISESLSPEQVVDELDKCFSYFDQIMEKYNLEKLKTIGDSYMCAGGIPKPNHTHAIDCCLAAMEIQAFMNQMKDIKAMQGLPYWELRLGIHTGPLVAGVVGHKKFAYDVWGDTVNTASRMESSGTTGRINISRETYEQVKFLFDCEHRGQVAAKNKGMIDMYYLNGLKHKFSAGGEGRGRVPNSRFKEVYAALARGAKLVKRPGEA